MNVEIRLYKRFDMDLVSLYDSGYSVANMIRDAVVSYANGTPIHFYIDEQVSFDISNKSSVHTRFSVPESDTRTCYLLRHIKNGYRNTFCKILLRNALVQQNLTGFFSDQSLNALQNSNLGGRNLYSYQNLIPCSTMRIKAKQSELLGNILATDKEKKSKSPKKKSQPQDMPVMNNPYMGMPVSPYPFMPQQYTGQPMQQPQGMYPAYPGTNPQQQFAPPVQPVPDAPTNNVPVPELAAVPPRDEPNIEENKESVVFTDDNSEITLAEDKSVLAMFDAL